MQCEKSGLRMVIGGTCKAVFNDLNIAALPALKMRKVNHQAMMLTPPSTYMVWPVRRRP